MKCGCDKKIEKELQINGMQNPRLQGFTFDFSNGFKKILTLEFLYNRINPKTQNYYKENYSQPVKAKFCPWCGIEL
ncbi:MAG: hypothetical protein GY777_17655 [Candidatus Brocadiaceae bacterium]|nr:hypothetical protein [Candidatus Brocadiaceae bacterium]